MGEDGLGDKILAGLVHPAGVLSHLREAYPPISFGPPQKKR